MIEHRKHLKIEITRLRRMWNLMEFVDVRPGQRAAGVGDVPKEPRKGYVRRKNHGTHDAKAADSSNGKVAPPKKNLK